jgi:hypothetical protein
MDSEPRKEGHVDVLTDRVEFLEERIVHITETSKDILELILRLQTEAEKRRGVEQGVAQEAQLTLHSTMSVYSESVAPGAPDIYSQPARPLWMHVKPLRQQNSLGTRCTDKHSLTCVNFTFVLHRTSSIVMTHGLQGHSCT